MFLLDYYRVGLGWLGLVLLYDSALPVKLMQIVSQHQFAVACKKPCQEVVNAFVTNQLAAAELVT